MVRVGTSVLGFDEAPAVFVRVVYVVDSEGAEDAGSSAADDEALLWWEIADVDAGDGGSDSAWFTGIEGSIFDERSPLI
jgi:hypothetical protein